MLTQRSSSDIDAHDWFCGIGGWTSGLVKAGIRIRMAANHSQVAINTHSANHPDVDHYLGDIQALDLRRLPRTRMLVASPICTEVSPSGGKKKRTPQMDLFEVDGHVETASFERTRVTFWEVIRAAELHRFDLVLIENVVEAAAWELFDVWLKGMETLGYEVQFCSVSAAHVGGEDNAPAAQWRDRLFMAFRRRGVRPLDLEPRPTAWCQVCSQNVNALQWWKPRKGQKTFAGRRIGKYGPQYLYVCPNPHRRNESQIVEPYVAPASTIIDWSDLGTRIGDRAKPLSAATMRRIEYGRRTFGDLSLVAAAGNTYDWASGASNSYVRAWPGETSPVPAQTGTQTLGFAASEPFVTMLRRNGTATGIHEPVATVAGGRHHGLTIPPGAFVMKHYGGRLEDKHAVKPVTDPLSTTVGRGAPTLVIPYRKGSKAHLPDRPVSTVATKSQHGLLGLADGVEDCHYRMFKPRESANSQRFDPNYILTGNKGEQQLGAGNAVPVNVAHWLGNAAIEALS